jgi:hydroxymethylbilane synthase
MKTGEYDAIVLAKAGVVRLNLESRISIDLNEKEYLYAPGQGALGV